MLARQEQLARLLTIEQGKPLSVPRVEIAYAASFYEWFGGEGRRVYGDTITASGPTSGSWCPASRIGVGAADHAVELSRRDGTRKAAPALAAGCTRVIEPAEQTPLSALAVGTLADHAGMPEGVLHIVTGDTEDAPVIGGELPSNPVVRKPPSPARPRSESFSWRSAPAR